MGPLIIYEQLQILNFFSRDEQEQLNNKLAALEKKIIVGGENLLEKAEAQERMLEDSAKELEERKQKEEELRMALKEKEVQRWIFTKGRHGKLNLRIGFFMNRFLYGSPLF